MKEKKRIFYYFCMLVGALLLFSGQAIYAAGTNTSQVLTNQVSSNSTSTSTFNWDVIWNQVKLIGGSLFGIITALITIYKFVSERNYDIKEIEIDLVNKAPPQSIGYTDFLCEKILKDDRTVKQITDANPFYLDVSIKINKALNRLVIRKLVINMNGYKLYYIPQNSRIKRWGVGNFNQDKKNEMCEILLKWPTIHRDDRRDLNPTMILRDPCKFNMNMYIEWDPLTVFSSVIGFVFPHKQTIVFEKIGYEKGVVRIGIKSRGIFKGKKNNGYNKI